ncbi:sulfur carrier protein ThiS [Candidatus Pelagibacter sp.]|nr:sulfur carrier protein ThiS [Candidatus Pelagibacter sp.]
MKKIKKIKIRVNGKIKTIIDQLSLAQLIKDLKIPLNKVAIELNKEIVNKKKVNKIKFKDKDNIEIVHFIGGG